MKTAGWSLLWRTPPWRIGRLHLHIKYITLKNLKLDNRNWSLAAEVRSEQLSKLIVAEAIKAHVILQIKVEANLSMQS